MRKGTTSVWGELSVTLLLIFNVKLYHLATLDQVFKHNLILAKLVSSVRFAKISIRQL